MGLPDGRKSFKIGLISRFDTIPAVTDRDTQPRRRSIYRAYYISWVTRSSANADKPARRV